MALGPSLHSVQYFTAPLPIVAPTSPNPQTATTLAVQEAHNRLASLSSLSSKLKRAKKALKRKGEGGKEEEIAATKSEVHVSEPKCNTPNLI